MSENITAFTPIIIDRYGNVISLMTAHPVQVWAILFMIALGVGMLIYGVWRFYVAKRKTRAN